MKKIIAVILALVLCLSAAVFAEGTEPAATETAAPAVEPAEPVAEEPVAEEPVAEEPVAEEPAEEPAAEEEAAEEPAGEIVEEPAEPDLNKTMYVRAPHGLKVHVAADLEAEVVVCTVFNQKVTVHSYDGKFARISYESLGETYEGYVWNEYLSEKITVFHHSSGGKVLGTCDVCKKPVRSNESYTEVKGHYFHSKCLPF